MKTIIITMFIIFVVVSCGNSRQVDIDFVEAVKNAEYEHAKQLLSQGADINYRDAELNWSAVQYAVNRNDSSFFFYLVEKQAKIPTNEESGSSMMVGAATGGNVKVMDYIYSMNTNINENLREKNSRGWTPLHAAIYFGKYEAAIWLLKRGANPNKYDYEGNTALHRAVKTGQPNLVRLVLKYGGDKSLKISGKYPVIDVTRAGVEWKDAQGDKWREIYGLLK